MAKEIEVGSIKVDERSCAESSLNVGEAMHGSAVGPVCRWVFIEVRERWEAKVPGTGVFDEAVHRRLEEWGAGARIQFIRHPNRREGKRRLFELQLQGNRVVRREWLFDHADELLNLDLQNPMEEGVLDSPVYFVCTHGTRDRCCAKLGTPVFRALDTSVTGYGRVWMTSHLGGHRFAPTLLTFPSGYLYGRVSPESVRDLVESVDRGQVLETGMVRGRVFYSPSVQAAELYLMQTTGAQSERSIRYLNDNDATLRSPAKADGRGSVHRFELRDEGPEGVVSVWEVVTQKMATGQRVLKSCSDTVTSAVEEYSCTARQISCSS